MVRKDKEKAYFDCKNNTKVWDVENDDIVMLNRTKKANSQQGLHHCLTKQWRKRGSIQIGGGHETQKRNVVHLKKINIEDEEKSQLWEREKHKTKEDDIGMQEDIDNTEIQSNHCTL